MTKAEQESVATAIVETVVKAIAPLKTRLDSVEAELVRIKAAPKHLAYTGVFQRAIEYHRHDGTTHRGQLWICVTDSTRGVEPGTSPENWQLAEKDHGR